MRGQEDYVTSGGGKKKNNPNSKKKIAARQTASKASGMSAQKFYVKTRMAEAAKSGKTLNVKDLRKKFQSGDVARKGFGAPKKKTGSASGSSTPVTSTRVAPTKAEMQQMTQKSRRNSRMSKP